MNRIDVAVSTDDGLCAATLHRPAGGTGPGVLVYPDAAGYRETFAAMADRLAQLGYAVLLPDLYYRTDYAPFDADTLFSDAGEFERLHALSAGLTAEMAMRDTGAWLEFLAGRPDVSGTLVGTTGYCMGGRLSLLAAGHYSQRIAAAASFHGGNLAAADDPDSPHLLADRIGAAVYVAAAQDDRFFPPEQHERLRQAFIDARLRFTIDTYAAEHGFAVPDNPTYDADADRRHWTALTDLYAETLHR